MLRCLTTVFGRIKSLDCTSLQLCFFPDWYLAFRGTPGIGGEPYLAWLQNTSYTTSDPSCHLVNTSACPLYYRSPIVDVWTNASVTRVGITAFLTIPHKGK